MPALELKIDTKRFDVVRSRLAKALQRLDTQGMFESIGDSIKESVRHRFETKRGPDGEDWEPSSSGWSGGSTLISKGHLRDSITHIASADGVEVGTNIIYAAIHQFGGKVEPKNGKHLVFQVGGAWVKVSSVTLPARPYLGLSAEDETEITAIVEDYIERALSHV